MLIYEVIGIVGTGEGAVQGITPPGSNGLEFSPLGGIYSPSEEEKGMLTPEQRQELLAVWTAQTNVIAQQSAYISDIKATFMEKRAQLPVGFSMQTFVESDIFKTLADMAIAKIIDWMTDFIPGQLDDLVLDGISKYGIKLLGAAIVWLQKVYYAGSVLCDRMKEENDALLNINMDWEKYPIRSDIIKQHEMSIQSLMAQVALAESQLLAEKGKEDVTQDDVLKKMAFEERVFECPYTGLCLGEKSGVAEESDYEMITA